MLAKAPNAISLPERRGQCNTPRPANAQSRARCASRLACLTDKQLSVDARLVYPLLDDYAGWKGTGWPKQQTISHRLGIPLRRVQAAVGELAATGWIVIERTGRANRYTLRWAADQIRRQCADRNSLYQPEVIEIPSAASNDSGVAIRPPAVSDRPAASGGENGGQPGQSDAHGPDAGGNPAKQGAPAVDVEAVHCPHCHGAGEREYRIPGGRDWRGNPIPARRWRGKCGCS